MKALGHKFLRLTFLLAGFICISSGLSAHASGSSIGDGRQAELLHLLKQDCGSCHGLTLKGGLGPSLLPQNLTGKPVSFLAYTIMNGRPGTAMPPWKGLLKPEEAEWLADVLIRGQQK